MPTFCCTICNKTFNRKSNFEYHTQDKVRPCSSVNIVKNENNSVLVKTSSILGDESSILRDESSILSAKSSIFGDENIKSAKASNNDTKSIEATEKANTNDMLFNKVDDNIINELYDSDINSTNNVKKLHICTYCDATFSRNAGLQRHINNNCKSKKYYLELESLKEKMKSFVVEFGQLKQQCEELKHSQNGPNISNSNNTNTNNSNNKKQINNGSINNGVVNNVNVQLVQFGEENIDKIVLKEAFDVYLNSTGGNIASNMLKYVNLNEKYPENNNVCITDLAREVVRIYNGKRFVIKKFKNVKGDILEKVLKNTRKLVKKISNNKNIKITPAIKNKMKINNASLKLIDGTPAEDIVRQEIRDSEKLLTNKNNNFKEPPNYDVDDDFDNDSDDIDSDNERDFNLEERLRIKSLEEKRQGLQEIAYERLKEELRNGKEVLGV
jgi:hypothetical protein